MIFLQERTPIQEFPDKISVSFQNTMAEQGFFTGNVFAFVGIYYNTAEHIILVGIPKYRPLPDSPNAHRALLDEVALICQVASQAQLPSSLKQDDQFQPFAFRSGEHYSNPYELAVFLLRDYAENGLYQERITKTRNDGIGSRSWSRTLRRTMPVFTPEPVYLHPVSVQHKRAFHSTITPLHAHVVNLCAKLLQPLQLFENLTLPDESSLLLSEFDFTSYIPLLNEKLTQVFSERDLRLLKALRAWCGQTPYNRTRFGTTSFELLWQYAANQYFGNIGNTKSGAPQYYRNGDREAFFGTGDAIPDILYATRGAAQKGCLAIFDAKYYCPKWNERDKTVWGAPSNSDIAKQIQYYHSIRQRYGRGIRRFCNAFLLPQPLESGLYQYMGYATENSAQNQEILAKIGAVPANSAASDPVLLYGVDPIRLWNVCLKGTRISQDEILTQFIDTFERVRRRMP